MLPPRPDAAGPAHPQARPNLQPRARRTFLATALVTVAPAALVGCAGPSVTDYTGERPTLDLRRYFDGEVLAHGIFVDRAGRVKRRFTVTMTCTWRGEEGELDERFVYSDGTQERRVWRLKHLGNGRYTGRADDVAGEAAGETAGNTFRWGYTLRLPVDGRVWEVQFDDWMHLIDDRVMLNRATMSKFGIRLGEVQLVFTRATPQRTVRGTEPPRPAELRAGAGALPATAGSRS